MGRMDRRNAIALSTSIAVTAAVGALAFASLGGMNILGFGSERHFADPPLVDASLPTSESSPSIDQSTSTTAAIEGQPTIVLLPGSSRAAGAGPTNATSPASGQPSAPGPTAPPASGPAATTPPATAPAGTAPSATVPAPGPTSPPATAAPSSTLPPDARIPSDWPPGTPIPPIPPGCKKPVLEDNGVWNCDH